MGLSELVREDTRLIGPLVRPLGHGAVLVQPRSDIGWVVPDVATDSIPGRSDTPVPPGVERRDGNSEMLGEFDR